MIISLFLILAVEPTLNRIPVFNLAGDAAKLEVAVWQTVYTTPAYADVAETWSNNPADLEPGARVMAQYVALIQDGGLDEALTLYDPSRALSRKERQMSAYMDKVLGSGPVAFERSYFFDRYQLIFVRPQIGDLITLGLVKVDGAWYRSDQWEWADGVRDLFYFMADNRRQGLSRPSTRTDHQVALKLKPQADAKSEYSLDLLSDGVFYPYRNTWRQLENHQDLDPVQARVIHAMQAAESGDDEGFLSMWSPETRVELAELQAQRPSDFAARRAAFTVGGGIKSVCSLDLGDVVVFYYFSRRDPLRLSTLYLKRTQTQSLLLTRDLSPNLRVFFESPPVEGPLNRQWLTYRKTIRKER